MLETEYRDRMLGVLERIATALEASIPVQVMQVTRPAPPTQTTDVSWGHNTKETNKRG